MQRIHDWYWQCGCHREGYYALGISDWLDHVSQISDRWEAIRDATNGVEKKACLAIWGPSQAGKSTLLSRYIDGDDNGSGTESALTWSPNSHARFSSKSDDARNIYPDTVILNPGNFGSDASGVATRFTLREDSEVEHRDYPVELRLASRQQLMHSVAAGYLAECAPVTGESVCFTAEAFRREISACAPMAARHSTPKPQREAYSLLKDAAEVIGSMVSASEPRFANLGVEDRWRRTLRGEMVGDTHLVSSAKIADNFLRKILWDDAPVLNNLFGQLVRLETNLNNKWDGAKVFCSLQAAALLLDIDSFKSYCAANPNSCQQRLHGWIQSLAWHRKGSSVLIEVNVNGNGADEIAGDQFALFQAIVAEIEIPLRKSVIEKRSRIFLEFMQACDILDFPGVPNQATAPSQASPLCLTNAGMTDLAQVVKRGKTLSIVMAYARSLALDGFAILTRAGRFPSHPAHLNAGIREWLKPFSPHWEPNSQSPLPLAVILTFFAKIANDFNAGAGIQLRPVADMIRDLPFARPTSAFLYTTTYPHFHDGAFMPGIDKASIRRQIMSDHDFMELFKDAELSIDAVFKSDDGGNDFFFRDMGSKISASRRFDLYRRIADADRVELESLLARALPAEDERDLQQRRDVLEKVGKCIESILAENWQDDNQQQGDPCMRASGLIRALLGVDGEIFDPLPQMLNEMQEPRIERYAKEQLRKWVANRLSVLPAETFTRLGLESPAMRASLLQSLADRCSTGLLSKWLTDLLGNLKSDYASRTARRSLAVAIGNMLMTGEIERDGEDLNMETVETRLQAFSRKPACLETSPHYDFIIKPFLSRLDTLRESLTIGSRAPQPGDSELQTIRQLVTLGGEWYGPLTC